ncbi:MAG TPA: hypothetical protein VHP33_11260 [Polyangiaceae bacterium]|nr:hypothetical protein [Polyangiaceae bacterium]
MIPVQLEYTAPTGCPTQTEFVAFVTNRGGDFAHPGPKTKANAMIVKLRREASEHVGSLELRLDDMASDQRQLHAPSCAEVAEALAVVAAIALRGGDSTEPAATPPVATSEPAAPVAPSAPLAPRPAPAVVPPPPSETRLRTVGLWGNEQVPVTAGPLQVKRVITLTLSGGAIFGAIPGVVLPRVDLMISRTNFITTPDHSSFLIGHVLNVGWSYFGGVERQTGSYSTKIHGFKGGVHSCSALTHDTQGFVALLCAGFTVGLVNLETKEAASDYHQDKLVGLGTAGLTFDARYNLGQHFHLNASAGGEMWMSTFSAERADGSKLFESRLFNANAQLGLGVHF